jgi:hypothetical protein
MTTEVLAAPTGWCMSGHHGPHEHCGGCPGRVGGQTFADPARKGSTFTTPVRLCPCWCHNRNLT